MESDAREPSDATFDGVGSPRFFSMGPGSRGRPRVHVYKGDTSRVTVGSSVTIARDVEFLVGANHRTDRVSTFPFQELYDLPGAFADLPWSRGDIVVGDRVSIGRGAKILSGVTVGDGASIAPFSVVTRDVAPGATVAGNPARVVDEGVVETSEHRRRRQRRRLLPRRANTQAVTMGRGTYFQPTVHATHTLGASASSVSIGSYSSLAEECKVFADRAVSIGNDVWFGRGVKVLSGVTIGDGAVVGAYSVVTADVRPYAVVVGDPAREVRRRFDDATVDALLRIKWWDWPDAEVDARCRELCGLDVTGFVARYDPLATKHS